METKDLFIVILQEDQGYTWPYTYHLTLESAKAAIQEHCKDWPDDYELREVSSNEIKEDFIPCPRSDRAEVVCGFHHVTKDIDIEEFNTSYKNNWCDYYIMKDVLQVG